MNFSSLRAGLWNIAAIPGTGLSIHLMTILCIVVFALCVGVHLRWHPLRQAFSDAWSFLLQHHYLLWFSAAALILNELAGGQQSVSRLFEKNFPLSTSSAVPLWPHTLDQLALLSLSRFGIALHTVFTPWPVAFLLPLLVTFLVWQIHRQPFWYDSKKPGPLKTSLLLTLALLTWAWLALEITARFSPLPEFLETVRTALRGAGIALFAASIQVWIIRLVMAWQKPVTPEEGRDPQEALHRTLARWPELLVLATWNGLWMTWPLWPTRVGFLPTAWLLPELLLLFAPLPVTVAWRRGSVPALGAASMRVLLRVAVPLLGLVISAVFLLMPVYYAQAVLVTWAQNSQLWQTLILPIHALALATVHNWLFLTAVLVLLRFGFRTPPPSSPPA